MKLHVIKEVRADDLLVFASLPDMGRVGGLASTFLSQYLKAETVAEIVSSEKPWVSYGDGMVRTVADIYKISYEPKSRILILTGESQPQDSRELYSLCNTFLDYVQSVGKIKRLYAAGGYLKEQLTGAPKVSGTVNKPELKQILAKAGIEFIGNEITTITWFNGLILGLCIERNIDALGLFGEISETSIPQPLAAKSILAAFARIENTHVDTRSLDKQYESILDDIEKQKKTTSGKGPGIG